MEVYEGEKIVQGYVVDQEMQEAVVVPQAAASAAAEQSEPVTSRSCQAALLLAVDIVTLLVRSNFKERCLLVVGNIYSRKRST